MRLNSSNVSRALLAAAMLTAFAAGCSPETPKKIPNVAKPPDEAQTKEVPQTVEVNSNVDILIVIDDSGSMDIHQANLQKNVDLFVDAISQNSLLDWRIGVVTTDMKDKNRKGKLYGFPRWVTKSTPDGLAALKDHMRPGISGDVAEKIFEPVMAALAPPLSDDYNLGFYRENAYLVLIFITDAEDQSAATVNDFSDWLLKMKGGKQEKIMAYGALAMPNSGCSQDQDGVDPLKILSFLSLTGGTAFNLCSQYFGLEISKIGVDVAKKISQTIYLNSRPIPGTIRVTFGPIVIPNDPKKGWIYDPEKNLIRLSADVDLTGQPAGTQIDVHYKTYVYTP